MRFTIYFYFCPFVSVLKTRFTNSFRKTYINFYESAFPSPALDTIYPLMFFQILHLNTQRKNKTIVAEFTKDEILVIRKSVKIVQK